VGIWSLNFVCLRRISAICCPTDPEAISGAFGYGWWKQDPKAAGELLEKAGFKKSGGKWMTPDGQPFKIRMTVEGDTRSVFTRAG
ncbi:hypothetical protein AB9F35_35065, partial [Rhizobium leguminosarum]